MSGAGLAGRVRALERRVGGRAGRMVYVASVVTSDYQREPPGSIRPWPNGRGYTLHVSWDHAENPMGGLSEQQRAFLRQDDQVTVIDYAQVWQGQLVGF